MILTGHAEGFYTMDETGFINELFEKHYPRLLTYCTVRLKNDEQLGCDAADSVFFIASQKKERLEQHPDPEGWLFKTANNVIRDVRKKQRRTRKRYFTLDPSVLSATVDSFERGIRLEGVLSEEADHADELDITVTDDEIEDIKEVILSSLRPEERELYELRFKKRLSVNELSSRYGISPAAVKMRLARIKLKITDKTKIYF